MSKVPSVCMIGCLGRMGQVISRGLLASRQVRLVGGVDLAQTGSDLGQVLNAGHQDVPIFDSVPALLAARRVDVAIDFSNAEAAMKNLALCLQAKVACLVGTTGLASEDLEKLHHLATKMHTPVLVVPNFAIGALLMMEFARKAVRYMPNVEIIEMHHPQKLDHPSGTAKLTREQLLAARHEAHPDRSSAEIDEIPVHSVRLPGLVAHQSVIFGDIGQTLTLRHDSFSRDSFLPGVLLGVAQIRQVAGLKIGLDL